MVARKSAEVVENAPKELADISDFNSALDYLRAKGIDVKSVQETSELLGDGFTFVQDKNQLVNRPFVVVDFRQGFSTNYTSDEGAPIPMVSVWGITNDGQRFKFIDMSTGIAQELIGATSRGNNPIGFMFTGLVRSDYDVKDSDGNKTGRTGTTYYLGS